MPSRRKTEYTMYPLGRNIFAFVKTRGKSVKCHLRYYRRPVNTKGGRLVATRKTVTLELKQFERLLKVKDRLLADFHQQTSELASRHDDDDDRSSCQLTRPPTTNNSEEDIVETAARQSGLIDGGSGDEGRRRRRRRRPSALTLHIPPRKEEEEESTTAPSTAVVMQTSDEQHQQACPVFYCPSYVPFPEDERVTR